MTITKAFSNTNTLTKTIVLLYPSIYYMPLWELKKTTHELCQNNNLEIVETIIARDAYDYFALRDVIRSIKERKGEREERQESITLVISEVENLSSYNFIPAWCVFDTLKTLRLVNSVLIFKSDHYGSSNEVSYLEECNRDFLRESVVYFRGNAGG